MDVRFSVGFTFSEAVKRAVSAVPEDAWIPAIDADGEVRDGAYVTEITHRLTLDASSADGWPEGTRVIVRRERPRFVAGENGGTPLWPCGTHATVTSCSRT